MSERYNLFRVEACGFLLEQIVLNAMIDNDLIFRVSAYSTFKKQSNMKTGGNIAI